MGKEEGCEPKFRSQVFSLIVKIQTKAITNSLAYKRIEFSSGASSLGPMAEYILARKGLVSMYIT